MKSHFLQETQVYNGSQLSSHWIYRNLGILGDAVAAFRGGCQVDAAQMVDLEDVLNGDAIYSEYMLHFIVELFGASLKEGVLLQRLFSSILQDRINADAGTLVIRRIGDDLFYNNTQKLSVSICTVSPTSVLIHCGLNIDPQGAPVEAAGLQTDLGYSPEQVEALALSAMRLLCEEWSDTIRSTCKVRAVP